MFELQISLVGVRLPSLERFKTARIHVEATIDSKVRRTQEAVMMSENDGDGVTKDQDGVVMVWKSLEQSSLVWKLDSSDIARLKAHNPRFRVSVMKKGAEDESATAELVGFVMLDFRQPELYAPEQGSTGEWLDLYGESGSRLGEDFRLQLLSRVSLAMPRLASPRSGLEQHMVPETNTDMIVAAFADDHIVIGSKAEALYTLSITLESALGLEHIASQGDKAGKLRLYWFRYFIFGVEICTDAFKSLKFPKFAPIRDSFKIKSNLCDLSDFLCSSPVQVALCTGPKPEVEAKVLSKCSIRFAALFDKITEPFAESACTCALPLNATSGETRNQPKPSLAITLELRREDQPALMDETMPSLPSPGRASNRQDQGRSVIEKPVILTVRKFELDPVEEDHDDMVSMRSEGVRLILRPGDADDENVVTSQVFLCSEYHDVEADNIRTLSQIAKQSDDGKLLCSIDCISEKDHSLVIGRGEVYDPKLDETQRVILYDPNSSRSPTRPNGTEIGYVEIYISDNISAVIQKLESPPQDLSPIQSPEEEISHNIKLELRSIRGLQAVSNVFVQFAYPLFFPEGVAHHKTKPPILVHKHVERVFPNGYFEYEFKCSKSRMRNAVQSEPLVFELWQRDHSKRDTKLGIGSLSLQKLLSCKPMYYWGNRKFATLAALNLYRKRMIASVGSEDIAGESGTATAQRARERTLRMYQGLVSKVRTLDTQVSVYAYSEEEEKKSKVGVIRVMVTLETATAPEAISFPRTETKSPPPSTSSRAIENESDGAHNQTEQVQEHEKTASPTISASFMTDSTEDDDEKMRLAREELRKESEALQRAWKDFEKRRDEEIRTWERQVREMEAARMVELEQEWAKREHQRALVLKKAQAEYQELEARLRRALVDAEKRERAVIRLENDLQRAAEQKMGDLEIIHRRNREECEHQVRMQKDKVAILEKRLKRTTEQLKHAEDRLKKVEDDYANFREQTRKAPEAVLQKEIAQLRGEKAELQARFETERHNKEAEIRAKEALKLQLVRVVQELQKVKRKQSLQAERDLEKLRLEYIAREERYVLDGDRSELRDIRRELGELRSGMGAARLVDEKHAHPSLSPPAVPVPSLSKEQKKQLLLELSQLEEERNELLESGIYDKEHPILAHINRHITLAMKRLETL